MHSIFRFEKKQRTRVGKRSVQTDHAESLQLGILFRDGSIEVIDKIEKDADDKPKIVPIKLKERISGDQIVSLITDEEHSRGVFIQSQDVDE